MEKIQFALPEGRYDMRVPKEDGKPYPYVHVQLPNGAVTLYRLPVEFVAEAPRG